ncbi:MAG: hypothetical protein J7M38_14495, partial [Armatimonadetes bacterium]|nr:hypothetical protein [Armatimonadota bacterium]
MSDRSPAPADPHGGAVLHVLRAHGLKLRLLRAVRGMLEGLAGCALLAAVVITLAGREVLLEAGVWAVAAGVIALASLARSVRPVTALEAALTLERAFPFLQDRVATVAAPAHYDTRAVVAGGINRRLAAEAMHALSDLPLSRALPVRELLRPVAVAAVALALVAAAWATHPPRTPAVSVAPP